MAKINLSLNGKNFSVDESVLEAATASLKAHLSSVMNGSGATINLGGTNYNVDSTKLATATSDFTTHLRSIAGNGPKISVGGIEFSIDSTKINKVMSGLHTHFEELVLPASVEELENTYTFTYFSTMVDAVNAIAGGTTDSGNTDRELAIAGVYTDENANNVIVLLKDTEERIQIASDMIINLGGHTLSATTGSAITINSGNVHIDGRLPGSTVNVVTPDTVTARAVAINKTAVVSINGGTYIAAGTNKASAGILCLGNLTASNATIIGRSTTARIDGISMSTGSSANVTNCNVYAYSDEGTANSVYVSKSCVVTITDSTTIGYSSYIHNGTSYTSSSMGVYQASGSTLTLNNCIASGTIAGIQTYGTLFVDGGTYEGFGHGGFYFTGSSAVAYVRNATIRECAFNEGYTTNNGTNEVGFYIGGGSNNSVYMDNCTIESAGHAIVLRTTSGEQNNALYISNSTIGENQQIRIDSTTHKLYLGVGNSFTAEDTTLPAAVIETGETYVYTETVA